MSEISCSQCGKTPIQRGYMYENFKLGEIERRYICDDCSPYSRLAAAVKQRDEAVGDMKNLLYTKTWYLVENITNPKTAGMCIAPFMQLTKSELDTLRLKYPSQDIPAETGERKEAE